VIFRERPADGAAKGRLLGMGAEPRRHLRNRRRKGRTSDFLRRAFASAATPAAEGTALCTSAGRRRSSASPPRGKTLVVVPSRGV
jgi:hypothetical protein